MHQQNSPAGGNAYEPKTSAMVSRLEGWHETYTRLNPWAHGGLMERVIQKLVQNAENASVQSREQLAHHHPAPSRLSLLSKDQASIAAGAQG